MQDEPSGGKRSRPEAGSARRDGVRAGRMLRLVAVLAVAVVLPASSSGQTPLYEQRPFDRITLDKANDNLVIDVFPLEIFPDRKLPKELPRSGKFAIERVDEPGAVYECFWRSVVKIELFEQLILNEVSGLVRAGRFEDAFDYFVHLKHEKPDLPGLEAAIDDYLYEEAKSLHRGGDYEGALARLREMFARNPDRPELERAMGAATERLVESNVAADQHWIARGYLDNLAELYPQHVLVAAWRNRFQQEAASHLATASKALEEGSLRDAHAAIRRMAAIWPDLPGAAEVRQTVALRYPRFVVGVLSPATATVPGRLNDWASRRSGRLVERTLLEFVGAGTEGGKYLCPVGQMKVEDLGRRLEFHLLSEIRVGEDSILTGYDLARQLLAMTDPARPGYSALWADLFASVSVQDVYTCTARLHRPFVLPQAMLQTPLRVDAAYSDAESGASIGPYFLDAAVDDRTTFLINASYSAGGPSRPKEIVEDSLANGAEGIRALQRGQIDVLDRINPWEIDSVRQIPGVVVGRYAAPMVHCLIPNPQGELSSRRAFRRAVVYGINREAILGLLTRGASLPGCRVISGPFSPGVGLDDPLDYAYEESIQPHGYEPHLAVALAEVALRELAEARKSQEKPLGDAPKTVLAYPPTEVARLAVTQIQRQLKVAGIEIELKELGPEVPQRIPEEVDLLYAELAMWEPLVDADRLLGDDGLMGQASPYMRQALLRLRQSVDWPTVGRQLRQIHQLAHSEVSIIPLWQLTDHFAHVESLDGIGEMPVTLYQNVEQWQTRPGQFARNLDTVNAAKQLHRGPK